MKMQVRVPGLLGRGLFWIWAAGTLAFVGLVGYAAVVQGDWAHVWYVTAAPIWPVVFVFLAFAKLTG